MYQGAVPLPCYNMHAQTVGTFLLLTLAAKQERRVTVIILRILCLCVCVYVCVCAHFFWAHTFLGGRMVSGSETHHELFFMSFVSLTSKH